MSSALTETSHLSSSAPLLEYRQPTTAAVPGPFARRVLARWPGWIWFCLAVSGLLPLALALGGPFSITPLYSWPLAAIVAFGMSAIPMFVAALVRLVARGIVRRHFGIASADLSRDGPGFKRAFATLAMYWLVAGTPLATNLAIICRSSALDSMRQRIEAGTQPAGSVVLSPFHLSDTENYCDPSGTKYVILYTNGARGTFPSNGCGLIYVPAGASMPSYNQGSDGHAFGHWHWFVTD